MSNEEKILAILEEHTKRFDSIDKKLESHDEDIKSIKHSTSNINNSITSINKKLDTHDQDIKTMKHSFSNINNSITSINNSITSINKKLNTHDKDIKTMKSSIINIEVQVTEKIPALFDAITVNMNKHEIYDNAISSLNAKTFNNKIRIEALEDSFKNLSVSA